MAPAPAPFDPSRSSPVPGRSASGGPSLLADLALKHPDWLATSQPEPEMFRTIPGPPSAADPRAFVADELPTDAVELRKGGPATVVMAVLVILSVTVAAGTWAWRVWDKSERDRAGRLDQAVREAEARVAEAERAGGDVVLWATAREATRWLERQKDDARDPAVAARIGALVESAARKADAIGAERALVNTLAALRDARSDDEPAVRAEAAYAAAFRTAGLEPDRQSPEELAQSLEKHPSHVRMALAAALDDWTALRRLAGGDPAAADRLAEAASLADPDPWRRHLRLTLGLTDEKARRDVLGGLAVSAPIDDLPPISLDLLGSALIDAGDAATAESLLRQAQGRFPGDVRINLDLARALEALGRRSEAVRYYTAVRGLKPELAFPLARALKDLGDSESAIAVLRDLTRLRPDNPSHFACLGEALREQGRTVEARQAFEAAVVACREALRRRPIDVPAQLALGTALKETGQFEAAVAAFREAIRHQPEDPSIHTSLGETFAAWGHWPDAIVSYREAIRLRPDSVEAHDNLGKALETAGRLDDAVAAYREAIRLRPDRPDAHHHLGVILETQGQYDAAIVEQREAIRLRPGFAEAHYRLGGCLKAKGQREAAIAAYREAIRVRPGFAEAHCDLGLALSDEGRHAESLVALEKGHELGSRLAGWPHPSLEWVERARRRVQLDGWFKAVSRGAEVPANPEQRIELASMCRAQGLDATATRLYARAFTDRPDLANSGTSDHRYQAACSAARAGCGLGKDETPLDLAARDRLRRQALDWLRAALARQWDQLSESSSEARVRVRRALLQWKSNPDLDGIRDKGRVAALPNIERAGWTSLWAEVDALLRKVQEPVTN